MTLVVGDRDAWVLPTLLRRRGAELGERPFASFAIDEASLTYAQADRESDRLAAGLHRLGVDRGDRVLLMLRNRVELVVAWFAVGKLGALQVAVNVDLRGEFLEHVANTVGAATLVVEDRFVEAVTASRAGLGHLRTLVVVGDDGDPAGPGLVRRRYADVLDGAPPRRVVAPGDAAAVHFTSGTTGRSKAAVIPHAAVHLLSERNAELLALDGESVYITELPLFHVNAQMTLYSALLVGAHARVEERFSATRWLDHVRAAGATHTSMLGVMLDFVLGQPAGGRDRDHALRSLWAVPCQPAVVEAFRTRFGVERVVTSYGTTEIGMVARRVVAPGETPPGLDVGSAFYDVVVADPETRAPVEAGRAGEIAVRPRLPSIVMSGYVGGSDRTGSDADAWIRTGDLGRLDEQGRLHFVDRLQDRLRRRGENVATADLEHVLGLHDAVAEVAVVAVPAPEGGGEDEIKACLVLQPGATLDPPAFWAWCDGRLPYFAVPRYVEVVDELPKTPTAKVLRQRLRVRGVTLATADRGPSGRSRRERPHRGP